MKATDMSHLQLSLIHKEQTSQNRSLPFVPLERNRIVSQSYGDSGVKDTINRTPQTFPSQQKRLSTHASLNSKTQPPQTVTTAIDVIVRSILACTIAFCVPYALFVYMQTREAAILGLATILGVAVGLVYKYYFPRRKGK
jgi:hypothetical protein